MADLPTTKSLLRRETWKGPAESVVQLTYDERYFKRRKIVPADGGAFVAAFDQTLSLDHGDAIERPGGDLIEVIAAPEALLAVTGPDLSRLAWHIGNRHTPCQIEAARLLIQRDPVIGHMLEHLGAQIEEVVEPFTPEGGAYGHGRTHSHDHGHTAHDHSAQHDHGHSHE